MATKSYNVILAKRADVMLVLHTDFLVRVSPAAARRLVSDFKRVKTRLAENPYQFPFADDLDVPGVAPNMYRKCYFYGRYKALFLIDGSDVFVDAVIDCRQENMDIFQ